MRKIFLLITVFLSFQLTFSANAEGEIQQTQGFLSTVIGLFSAETLLNIIFAIVVILLTFVISAIARTRLFSYLERSVGGSEGGKVELVGLITRTVNIVILITGFSITLGVLGVDLGIFMGGIGFGIGFTLKTFLTNFVSGIIMITQGKFNNGDLIEIGSRRGKIITINALFTEIEQLDGVILYIPNIKFLEEDVSNFYTNDKRRLEVEVLLEYGEDVTKAKKVIIKVLESFPMILKSPKYQIIVEKLSDSGILVRILFWTSSKESYISMKSNVTETVNLAFSQSDINIAFPHLQLINNK